jgi:hypothetical protein
MQWLTWIQVYTLEKVLRLKRDSVTQAEFLEEVMKVRIAIPVETCRVSDCADEIQRMDEKPSFTFWTTLAQAFESQTKEASRSTFHFP